MSARNRSVSTISTGRFCSSTEELSSQAQELNSAVRFFDLGRQQTAIGHTKKAKSITTPKAALAKPQVKAETKSIEAPEADEFEEF